MEQFHQTKNDFMDDLINLKLNFFTKLNHLKIIFLILHKKAYETRTYSLVIIRQYYISERPAAKKTKLQIH